MFLSNYTSTVSLERPLFGNADIKQRMILAKDYTRVLFWSYPALSSENMLKAPRLSFGRIQVVEAMG